MLDFSSFVSIIYSVQYQLELEVKVSYLYSLMKTHFERQIYMSLTYFCIPFNSLSNV